MVNIPVLSVKGESIPEAWERSVVELYENGLRYCRDGPKDKGREQIDSTMTIEVENPDHEFFMHRGMSCGIDGLLEYQMEMLGAKNSLVVNRYDNTDDPRWPYAYNERFSNYPSRKEAIDQIEGLIQNLINEPHMRRANMITCVPEKDIKSDDPPCLQNVWFFLGPEGNDSYLLNMNYVFRSRNVMIAAPMNMVGLYTLQCYVRDKINERSGLNVKNGRIVDFINSYHVRADGMENLEKFIESLGKRNFEDRVWSRSHVFGIMLDELQGVKEKIIGQVRNRCEERKNLSKNSGRRWRGRDLLDIYLEDEIGRIDEISGYMEEFLRC